MPRALPKLRTNTQGDEHGGKARSARRIRLALASSPPSGWLRPSGILFALKARTSRIDPGRLEPVTVDQTTTLRVSCVPTPKTRL